MANPSSIYKVTVDGDELPGYVQQEDLPLEFRLAAGEAVNRNGGSIASNGASLRTVTLTMLLISRLSANSSGLQHLNDCRDQLRDAYHHVARDEALVPIKIGDTDRYLTGVFKRLSSPLTAGESAQRQTYTVEFLCKPYFESTTLLSDTIAGDGTLSVTVTGTTARTYPVFLLPSGLNTVTLTHPDGKTITFTRGDHVGTITVDCGRLTAIKGTNTSVVETIEEVNWGFAKKGTGDLDIDVTDYGGTGTITMQMRQRYER